MADGTAGAHFNMTSYGVAEASVGGEEVSGSLLPVVAGSVVGAVVCVTVVMVVCARWCVKLRREKSLSYAVSEDGSMNVNITGFHGFSQDNPSQYDLPPTNNTSSTSTTKYSAPPPPNIPSCSIHPSIGYTTPHTAAVKDLTPPPPQFTFHPSSHVAHSSDPAVPYHHHYHYHHQQKPGHLDPSAFSSATAEEAQSQCNAPMSGFNSHSSSSNYINNNDSSNNRNSSGGNNRNSSGGNSSNRNSSNSNNSGSSGISISTISSPPPFAGSKEFLSLPRKYEKSSNLGKHMPFPKLQKSSVYSRLEDSQSISSIPSRSSDLQGIDNPSYLDASLYDSISVVSENTLKRRNRMYRDSAAAIAVLRTSQVLDDVDILAGIDVEAEVVFNERTEL